MFDPCQPPPPPGGCYEYPCGSGQIVCVDGPWPAPAVIPTLDWAGLLAFAAAMAVVAVRRLRSA